MSTPTTIRRAPANKWLVTLSVSVGTFMAALDASIINVALPQIRSSVGATLQEITWASTSFIIASVLVMPLTGFLGRLFGQKRTYMVCLAVFVASSFLCGMAWNLPALVLFRMLQGMSAGLLTPTEQAILRQAFPPEEQGMAMALFTAVIMVGPAVGPTLGGYIIDNFHWSWIFFINLPVGVLGLLLVWRFYHEPEDVLAANRAAAEHQRRNMDWAGIALLWVGLAALQYLLEEGQREDWFESSKIIACAVVAGLSLAAFVLRELTAPVPAVNLRLFKEPVFTSGALLGGVMFFILTSNLFLLPIFMQELLGFTAMQSGLTLLPRTLLMLVMIPIIGRLYNLLPPRLTISVGLLFITLGTLRMTGASLDMGSLDITLIIVLQGFGSSLLFVPLNTLVFDNVPRAWISDATGLNALMRQFGTSVGLALFATLLTRYNVQAQVGLSAQLVPERLEVFERLSQGTGMFLANGLDLAEAQEASLRLLAAASQRQAMMLSFDRLFVLSGMLLVVSLPLLFLMRTAARAAPRKEEQEVVHVDVEV